MGKPPRRGYARRSKAQNVTQVAFPKQTMLLYHLNKAVYLLIRDNDGQPFDTWKRLPPA